MRLGALNAQLDGVNKVDPPAARGGARRILRTVRRVWIGAGLVFTVAFIAFNVIGYRATDEARTALETDGAVEVVETGLGITFSPTGQARQTALLFYAGALVEPAAYAPFLRRVAEEGYVAVLVPLPARSAPTERHMREAIARGHTFIDGSPSSRWIVGGHSKGGAVAAQLVAQDPRATRGLLLVGTTHPRELSLASLPLPVVKVSASNDGLAAPAEVTRFASNLPADTRFVEIAGGNHAQFGYYGLQFGDRRASIPREEQQRQLLDATLGLLVGVEERP
jgi:dienelactone hydrolase